MNFVKSKNRLNVWAAIYFLGRVVIHIYSESLNQIEYNSIITDILLPAANNLYVNNVLFFNIIIHLYTKESRISTTH